MPTTAQDSCGRLAKLVPPNRPVLLRCSVRPHTCAITCCIQKPPCPRFCCSPQHSLVHLGPPKPPFCTPPNISPPFVPTLKAFQFFPLTAAQLCVPSGLASCSGSTDCWHRLGQPICALLPLPPPVLLPTRWPGQLQCCRSLLELPLSNRLRALLLPPAAAPYMRPCRQQRQHRQQQVQQLQCAYMLRETSTSTQSYPCLQNAVLCYVARLCRRFNKVSTTAS